MSNLKDNRIITSELCYAYPEAEKNAVDHVNTVSYTHLTLPTTERV